MVSVIQKTVDLIKRYKTVKPEEVKEQTFYVLNSSVYHDQVVVLAFHQQDKFFFHPLEELNKYEDKNPIQISKKTLIFDRKDFGKTWTLQYRS